MLASPGARNRDPFGTWTTARKVRWTLLAIILGLVFAPRFFAALMPPKMQLIDFYQEWSSAKNVVEGLPTYAPLEMTVERYLGVRRAEGTEWYWDVNVHPPTSVLLAMPLQGLSFRNAFFAWNVASLVALTLSIACIVHELGWKFSHWNYVPILTLGSVCDPLYQQVIQGQLNLILLLLIVGIWVCDRRGWQVAAGGLLAVAAAVKLFPAFLGLYFLIQRKWRAVGTAGVTFLLVTVLTGWITGWDTYRSYVTEILPQATRWKSTWNNASVAGLWHKLLAPGSRSDRYVNPLDYPTAAFLITAGCCAVLVLALSWTIYKSHTQRTRDAVFGLSITTMLLVSPVTWEHYFLMLLLPLALAWVDLPRESWARITLGLVLAVLFMPIIMLCNVWIPGGFFEGQATWVTTVTLLSMQLYALLGLLTLGYLGWYRGQLEQAAEVAS